MDASGEVSMPELELFTPTGVMAGSADRVPLSPGGPDLLTPLALEAGRWYPIDGGPPAHLGQVRVDPDDILIVASQEPEMLVHLTWYPVVLEVGPYRVRGSLATHPGFDPAKAIARPSSGYVPLRDAVIELVGRDDAGSAERAHVYVNRYAVEKAASALMLGFFFPGARLAPLAAVPVG